MFLFGYFKFKGKQYYTVFLIMKVQVAWFCKVAEHFTGSQIDYKYTVTTHFYLVSSVSWQMTKVVLRNEIEKFRFYGLTF